jgi:hypothetical protein
MYNVIGHSTLQYIKIFFHFSEALMRDTELAQTHRPIRILRICPMYSLTVSAYIFLHSSVAIKEVAEVNVHEL